MDGSATGIPEWVLWVGASIGSMLGALVIRLGWKSGGGEKSSSGGSFILDAALVDSASIKLLTAAIEAATMEAIEARKEREKLRALLYRAVELGDHFRDEIKDLRTEIRMLGDAVARRR